MGSSSEKTVTQADAQPWEAAQPLLKKGIGEAEDLFDVGGMFQPNTTSQVVPWSDNTQAGMSDIQNRAAQGMAGGTGMDAGPQGTVRVEWRQRRRPDVSGRLRGGRHGGNPGRARL